MKHVRAIVSGLVQGVWFRASTCDKARVLGVRGYVRNLPGGEVELVAEGEDTAVDELLEWAKQGPPGAHVEKVAVETLFHEGKYEGFRVQY